MQELPAPVPGEGGYQQFNPRTEILPTGWSMKSGSKKLGCDILVEHDVGITVRDGCKLYVDIYRPNDEQIRSPAIICWSPFGKKFNGIDSLALMVPWNLGIPDNALSGLEKFEAPDPADWVDAGYAVVNVDSRGAFDSEGMMAIMGTQEAEDGYDVIEHVAKLPWCSGKVGLAGNSHLAIIQWFIASLRPPSLAAIAPWEGCGDLMREQFIRGGIYMGHMFDGLIVKHMLKGRYGMESFRKMYEQSPLANAWWNDKRPCMSKIQVPTYITGTWSNTMHGMGAIRGWLEVDTPQKWLRFHPHQEWYDLWGSAQAKRELFQFFDHYLKGADNGWRNTPKVRVAALKFGEEPPVENIVVEDFPVPDTEYRTMYLGADGTMGQEQSPLALSGKSYDAEDHEDFAAFTYVFLSDARMLGIPKAVLFMSCDDYDDMDVFIVLRKLDSHGQPMLALNIPWNNLPVHSISEIPEDERTEVIIYKGPSNMLRASQRAIDSSMSMHEHWPFHPQDKEEKVAPGSIVRLDIGIWATGIDFKAGEAIQLQVSGHFRGVANFGSSEDVRNRGEHTIHCGKEHNSHVILPFVRLGPS